MPKYFNVKNWDSFQHYKDRNPPWIKLHNHLLDNYEFECLPDASKSHLLCIWMLASRTQNKMPMDSQWIKRKIGASSTVDLNILVDSGFLELIQELPSMEHDASKVLVSEEKRRGETEKRRGETEKRRDREEKDLLSSKHDIAEVIKHFNYVTGQNLRASAKSHSQNISARLSEGHTVDDLKSVTEHKHGEWRSDAKMSQYIRPSTLFQAGKFNGYLQQARTVFTTTSSLHDLGGIIYKEGDL